MTRGNHEMVSVYSREMRQVDVTLKPLMDWNAILLQHAHCNATTQGDAPPKPTASRPPPIARKSAAIRSFLSPQCAKLVGVSSGLFFVSVP